LKHGAYFPIVHYAHTHAHTHTQDIFTQTYKVLYTHTAVLDEAAARDVMLFKIGIVECKFQLLN